MRRRLISIALVFGSVILAMGLAEAALRVAHYGQTHHVALDKAMQYDPLLGWRNKPGVSIELVTPEYRTILHRNASGLRGSDRQYSKPQNVSRIIVLGDSFVDGYTVRTEDRLTEVLEASLGGQFEVINLGVSGYSTDQELLMLEQEGWKYQPDVVVLAFYFNDVWGNASSYLGNNVNTKKPFFARDASGELRLSNVPVPYPAVSLHERMELYDLIRTVVKGNHWLHQLATKVGLAYDARHSSGKAAGVAGYWALLLDDEFKVYETTESPDVKKEWAITQALLRRMKLETEQRGVPLVVFYVPTRVELSPEEWRNTHLPPAYDPGEVARRLAGICKAEGLPYIDPSDRFKESAITMYYANDPHWNAAGHHLAGQMLAEYVRATTRGLAPVPSPGGSPSANH